MFHFKPWVLVTVVFLATITRLSAQNTFIWDFESQTPSAKWSASGFKDGTDYKRIVEIVTIQPHGGSSCLQVRDEVANANPYATCNVKIDPSKSYTFSGWVRGEKKAAGCHIAPVALMNERGEFIKWHVNERFDVDTVWKPFSVIIKDMPSNPNIKMLGLSLSATRELPMQATGMMWFDDLRLEETPMVTLNMKSVVNMDFKDDRADDGQGGWTDQGPQDWRYFKAGLQQHGNVSFDVIDPKANGGKAVLVLGNRSIFARSASVPVNNTAKYIYLLHTSAWASPGTFVGYLDLVYQDKTTSTIRIVSGDQLSDWFKGPSSNSHAIQMEKPNDVMANALLHATSIGNPHPEKVIQSMAFRSTDQAESKALWIVLAATLGSTADLIEKSRWIENTLLIKGSELESLGLIDSSTLKVTPVPLRLSPGETLDVKTSIHARLRPTVKTVSGIAFHRIGGWGNGPYSMPYDRETGKYTLTSGHEEAIRDLRIPMTRFYGVGCESFGLHGAIDRIVELLGKTHIPQETTVIELEIQAASEKFDPAVWGQAAKYVVEKGYRFTHWEIGNEVSYAASKKAYPTPESYVAQVKAVSQAIRKEQPQARIGLSVEYGNTLSTLWGNYVLKAAAGHYDYVVFHWYEFREVKESFEESIVGCNNLRLNEILRTNELIKQYNPTHKIRQYDTEWARHVYPEKRDELHLYRPNGNILGTLYQAVRLIYYGREEILDGACAWGMIGWAQRYQNMSQIACEDSDLRTMSYWLFYYYNRHFGDWVLDIQGTAPCLKSAMPLNKNSLPIPLTPLMITASNDGSTLYIIAANASWTKDYPCNISVAGFRAQVAEGVLLTDDDMNARQWVEQKSTFVRPVDVQLSQENIAFQIPKHSMVFVKLSRTP